MKELTQYQVYETNTADTLSVAGVAERTATSAATACTLTSLAGLDLTAGAARTDTVEVRASNGTYWGDWTALTAAVAAPVTAAAAIASTGTAPLSVADTAANIGADADKLQALGSGPATITAGLSGTSGVTTVANFQFGMDALQLDLGALPSVQAFNTTRPTNGAQAIVLTGGAVPRESCC